MSLRTEEKEEGREGFDLLYSIDRRILFNLSFVPLVFLAFSILQFELSPYWV